MNVVLFGASGMVGGGVLTECLADDAVAEVRAVSRRPLGIAHPKVRGVVVADLFELQAQAHELGTPDACLYCLGVSSAGMSEAAYRRVTFDLTVVVADVVGSVAPDVTFCFVSGQGTGSGNAMWARVKHEAEQMLLERPFETVVFRPGFIQPVAGARSRTAIYRALYTLLGPLTPVLRRLAPGSVTDSRTVARAMIRAARGGAPKRVLETSDINGLGRDG